MKTAFDIICRMRLFAAFVLLPAMALGVTVGTLPPSEFADTEISTNIAFIVDRSMMTRIEFTVALDVTPTNNVEVAIGEDENGDGNLSVEESAYVFGFDCGTWFCRDRDKNKIENTTVDLGLRPRSLHSHTFILKKHKLDTAWDTVKVTRRGCGAVCELVKAEGRKPGFKLEVR